jgi:hypothetical protein
MQIDPTMYMKTKDTLTKCPAKCRTFAAIEFHKNGHLRQLSPTDAVNAVFWSPLEALLEYFSDLMSGRNAPPRAFVPRAVASASCLLAVAWASCPRYRGASRPLTGEGKACPKRSEGMPSVPRAGRYVPGASGRPVRSFRSNGFATPRADAPRKRNAPGGRWQDATSSRATPDRIPSVSNNIS